MLRQEETRPDLALVNDDRSVKWEKLTCNNCIYGEGGDGCRRSTPEMARIGDDPSLAMYTEALWPEPESNEVCGEGVFQVPTSERLLLMGYPELYRILWELDWAHSEDAHGTHKELGQKDE